MLSLVTGSLNRLRADEDGSFATTFALIAPVLLIAVSATVNYSYTASVQQRTQAAADSAALAATIALSDSIKNGRSMTTDQAQAVAAQYFKANAPADAIANQVSPVAPVTTTTNNVVTTTISFKSNPPTLFSNFLSAQVNVVATANSSVTVGHAAAVGTMTGSGWVAEDPLVMAPDGTNFFTNCDITHVRWYNLLSDSNVEVNANCDGAGSWSELYQFSFLLGSHVVTVTPTLQNSGYFQNTNREIWYGAVTVDGQSYAAPSIAGTTTVLDDQTNKFKAQVVIGQPNVRASAANYLLVTTPNYRITVAYDSDNDGIDLGLGDIQIAATNAGACGKPGGIWGQTLSRGYDANAEDFRVASATTTAPEFSKFCGAVASAATKAKLIQ